MQIVCKWFKKEKGVNLLKPFTTLALSTVGAHGFEPGPSACKAELLTFFCFLLSSFVYAIKYLKKITEKLGSNF
jgi:hypothetical protein